MISAWNGWMAEKTRLSLMKLVPSFQVGATKAAGALVSRVALSVNAGVKLVATMEVVVGMAARNHLSLMHLVLTLKMGLTEIAGVKVTVVVRNVDVRRELATTKVEVKLR